MQTWRLGLRSPEPTQKSCRCGSLSVTPALWGQRRGIPRASQLARPLGSSKLLVEREREQNADRRTETETKEQRETKKRDRKTLPQ